MDQIAVMGLKVLAAYKQQLDAAAEKVAIARALARRIEIFEVTITMIPKRGESSEVKKITSAVPGGEEEAEEKAEEAKDGTMKGKAKNYVKDAAGYAIEQATGAILDQAKDFINQTPFAIVADLLQFGDDDKSPIMNDMRPADILNKMRENGANDLEVSFVAMRFIIHSALRIVGEAVDDVKLIEIPDCLWMVMPWKVSKQNEVGERLAGHLEAIDKFNSQLQSAISVASYCVSLEQLENVLNATSMLACLKIREFWKRKIGITNTRVKMAELAESFLDEVSSQIELYKKANRHIPEKVSSMRSAKPEVALGRFLSNLWNGNGDATATVYEVNQSTEIMARKFGKNVDAIGLTFESMKKIETSFYSNIQMLPLTVNAGTDGIEGTSDDFLVCLDSVAVHQNYGVELNANDKVVTLKPFQRLRIVCKTPYFDTDIFPFDFISLMRYENIKGIKQLAEATGELVIDEVDHTRTFLCMETNKEFYGGDYNRWNAPRVIRDANGKDRKIDGFKRPGQNFEISKGMFCVENEDGTKGAKTPLEEGGVTDSITLLYTPIIMEPGVFTVRLVLDDLELDERETPQTVSKKKVALSPKSYYYNRDIYQQPSENTSKVFYDKASLGEMNYQSYLSLTLKQLDLDNREARADRDLSWLKLIFIERSKLLQQNPQIEVDEAGAAAGTNAASAGGAGAKKATPSPAAVASLTTPAPASTPAVQSTTTTAGAKRTSLTKPEKANKEVEMYSNPMVAKVPASPSPAPAAATPTPVKVVDEKEVRLHAINKISQNLLMATDNKCEQTKAYIQSMKTKSTKTGVSDKELVKIELELARFELSFEVKRLIGSSIAYFRSLLNDWLGQLQKNVNRKLLVDADNCLRSIKGFKASYKSLVPLELQEKYVKDDASVPPPAAGDSDKKCSYLFDPSSDRTDLAFDCLSDQLFVQYYICKSAILLLDAKESTSQQNIRRLELLQDKSANLEEKLDKCVTNMNSAATASNAKGARGSIAGKSGETTAKFDGSTARALIDSKQQYIQNMCRNDAIQLATSLIKDIDIYIETLLDVKKRTLYLANVKTAEHCQKVCDELNHIQEQAKHLPQNGSPSLEEDLQIAKHRVIPPFGLIVLVEDVCALAWGEPDPSTAHAESSDESTGAEDPNSKVDQNVANWRPQIEFKYPYGPKSSTKINKNYYDFNEEKPAKPLTFAIFYNTPLVKKKDAKKADAEVAEADDKAEKVVVPTQLAVYIKGSDGTEDRMLGAPIDLDKNVNFIEVNFQALIRENTSYEEKAADKMEMVVCFLHPAAGSDAKAEQPPAPVKMMGSPELLLCIEDMEDEDEDEEDDYYGYDDEDSDEDHDYDEDECIARGRETEANDMDDILPAEMQIDEHHHKLTKETVGEAGCDICGQTVYGIAYCCVDCGFEAHPQCACGEYHFSLLRDNYDAQVKADQVEAMADELPEVLCHEAHAHELRKMPLGDAPRYFCDICRETLKGLAYRCTDCGWDAHPQCVCDVFCEQGGDDAEEEEGSEAEEE